MGRLIKQDGSQCLPNYFDGMKLPGIPDELLAGHDMHVGHATISGFDQVIYRLVYAYELISLTGPDDTIAIYVNPDVIFHTFN